jgi:hypothetical protein
VRANDKLYVETRGKNTGGAYGSSSVSGKVDVYGLKPKKTVSARHFVENCDSAE